MKRKILLISAMILIIILTSLKLPVTATSDINENGIFSRTNMRAIGRNFHICEDDGGLYGHIFIGLKGLKPVFNEDVYIPEENIRFIFMINSFYVHCKYIE